MTRLLWDQSGERFYETGTKNGVLYPRAEDGTYPKGVAWNGLTSVSESPSGAEESPLYADDIKYLSLRSAEEFGCTIEAYTYPDEWAECDGSAELVEGIMAGQQHRNSFGLSYRTVLGNDVQGDSYGYKLHLVYGGTASPSEKAYASVNDSPEAVTFSWEVTTNPVEIKTEINGTKLKPTSILTIDSTKVGAAAMTAIESILYGSENSEPRLPLPDEILTIIAGATGSTGATGETA